MDGFRNPDPTPSKVVEYKGLSFKRIVILKMEIPHPIGSKIWMKFVLKMISVHLKTFGYETRFKKVIPYPEHK